MWHHPNLGQGFCKVSKAPCRSDKEGCGFCLGPDQKSSMEDLKQAIITAPCLCPSNITLIDVSFSPSILLALPLVLFFCNLVQITNGTQVSSVLSPGMKGNHATLKQKIEIYSLWHALQAYWLTLLASKSSGGNDANYIKGMLTS